MQEKNYLRLVIERDDEGGIMNIWLDGAEIPVEVWIADGNLDNAEKIVNVEGIAMDVWPMDTIRSEPDVAKFLDAALDGAMEVLLDEPIEPFTEDGLTCEFCGVALPQHLPDCPAVEIEEEEGQPVEEQAPDPPVEQPEIVEGDDPNCDYCGRFVGYGLREDFPKLACEDCDSV